MTPRLGLEGLFDVVVGPHLEGLHGAFNGSVTGDDDHQQFRVNLSHRPQHVQAALVAKIKIQQHQVDLFFTDQLHRLFTAFGGKRPEAIFGQYPLKILADKSLVIDDQYFFHGYSLPELRWRIKIPV